MSILTLITCKNEQELRFNTKITRIDTLKQVEPIINDVVISEMSQAYGFNFAQMYSLKLIKINNPNLEGKVELAKLKFEKSFDNSIITIDSILSTHNSKWREIKDKLSGQINTRTETNTGGPLRRAVRRGTQHGACQAPLGPRWARALAQKLRRTSPDSSVRGDAPPPAGMLWRWSEPP